MKKVDLHIHTNLSDGLLSPEAIIEKASQNNCQIISITDHEIITPFSELEKKYNIKIIPGIEFNTAISNLHLLGYNIENINEVNNNMYNLRKKNERICFEIIELMKKSGYDISIEKIVDYLKENNISYDFIDKRKIVKYLIFKGYIKTTIEAYKKLIGKDTKFYIPNYKLEPIDIIDLINSSKGIAVLAHPETIKKSIKEEYNLIYELTKYGLSGIEIFNQKMHSNNEKYIKLADELGLLKTVGSDFHEPISDEIGISIDDKIYEQIHKKLVLKK